LTESLYRDYLLSVTFKAEGILHAGIQLCFSKQNPGPRIEIFQGEQNQAFTGSLWIPERGLALLNIRKDLYTNQGWNTISARVEENKVHIWLNGEEIGLVRLNAPTKGKIGLHIDGHNSHNKAKLRVHEILIKPLE